MSDIKTKIKQSTPAPKGKTKIRREHGWNETFIPIQQQRPDLETNDLGLNCIPPPSCGVTSGKCISLSESQFTLRKYVDHSSTVVLPSRMY